MSKNILKKKKRTLGGFVLLYFKKHNEYFDWDSITYFIDQCLGYSHLYNFENSNSITFI